MEPGSFAILCVACFRQLLTAGRGKHIEDLRRLKGGAVTAPLHPLYQTHGLPTRPEVAVGLPLCTVVLEGGKCDLHPLSL